MNLIELFGNMSEQLQPSPQPINYNSQTYHSPNGITDIRPKTTTIIPLYDKNNVEYGAYTAIFIPVMHYDELRAYIPVPFNTLPIIRDKFKREIGRVFITQRS
jgi:hypothetical protein